MIQRIIFKDNYGWEKGKTIFDAGLEIKLQPGINVLVGDQGTGKSTLIELVRTWLEPDKGMNGRLNSRMRQKDIRETIEVEGDNLENLRVLAFDFEKDATRSSGAFDWGGPIDTVGFMMHGNRASHGEANKLALNMLLKDVTKEAMELVKAGDRSKKIKPTLVLLDEPDSALSIASILMMHTTLRALERMGCQVIVSAHNPFLLGCFHDLFSLKHKKWITYSDYVVEQTTKDVGEAGMVLFTRHYQSYDGIIKDAADKLDEGEAADGT